MVGNWSTSPRLSPALTMSSLDWKPVGMYLRVNVDGSERCVREQRAQGREDAAHQRSLFELLCGGWHKRSTT